MSIEIAKVKKYISSINRFLSKKWCILRDLQEVICKVCYCAYVNKCIKAHTFVLCKMLSIYNDVSYSFIIDLHTPFDVALKHELSNCKTSIARNPKISFSEILDQCDENTVEFFTYASLKGMRVFTRDIGDSLGVHFSIENNRFYDLTENPNMDVKNYIAFKELLAVILAVTKFKNELSGKNMVFFVDNENVCFAIEKCHAGVTILHHPLLILLRVLCMAEVASFRAIRIPSKLNVEADNLSRLEIEKFRSVRHYSRER